MPAMTEVKLSTVSYVIFYVPDTEKALPYYRDKLGMKVKMAEPGWAELDAGTLTLALHSAENLPSERQAGQATVVFSVEDIYHAYDALKDRGIKFEKEPQQVCEGDAGKLGLSADFKDPYGNRLSIFGYAAKKR